MYLPGSDFPDTVHGRVKLGSYIGRHLTDFIVTRIQVACHHVTQTLVWAAGDAEEPRQALSCDISRVEWGQSVPANLRRHEVVDGPFQLRNWKRYVSLSRFVLSLDSPLCQKVRTVALDVQPSRLVAARRQQSQTQGTSKTHSSGTWPCRFLQQPEIETRKNREYKSIIKINCEHSVHIKIMEKLNSKGIPLYCTC